MTRVVADLAEPTSFDFRPRAAPLDFEALLGVFYTRHDYTTLGAIRAPVAAVREMARTNRDSRRLHWTEQTAAAPCFEAVELDTD